MLKVARLLLAATDQQLMDRYKVTPEEILEAKEVSSSSYTEWVIQHWKGTNKIKPSISFPTDIEKYKNLLIKFDKVKRSPAFTGEKSIDKYTPQTLFVAMDKAVPSKKEQTRETIQARTLWSGEVDSPTMGNVHVSILNPAAVEELMKLGGGPGILPDGEITTETSWCTTQRENAEDYWEQNPDFYIIKVNGKNYCQIHHGNYEQCKDASDAELDLTDPILAYLFQHVEALPKPGKISSYKEALEYAQKWCKGRWIPGEPVIATNAYFSYLYISLIHRRDPSIPIRDILPASIPTLAKNPDLAQWFAKFSQEPFPEGEAAIATEATPSLNYTLLLQQLNPSTPIRELFPQGIPAIAKNGDMALNFAYMLEEPFPEGEAAISRAYKWADYRNFLEKHNLQPVHAKIDLDSALFKSIIPQLTAYMLGGYSLQHYDQTPVLFDILQKYGDRLLPYLTEDEVTTLHQAFPTSGTFASWSKGTTTPSR